MVLIPDSTSHNVRSGSLRDTFTLLSPLTWLRQCRFFTFLLAKSACLPAYWH